MGRDVEGGKDLKILIHRLMHCTMPDAADTGGMIRHPLTCCAFFGTQQMLGGPQQDTAKKQLKHKINILCFSHPQHSLCMLELSLDMMQTHIQTIIPLQTLRFRDILHIQQRKSVILLLSFIIIIIHFLFPSFIFHLLIHACFALDIILYAYIFCIQLYIYI